MRIKSVRLFPFAAAQNREFRFEKGLNVLLGPNEAGKSTLFQAVSNGLFTSTNKTAKQLMNEMGQFFPAGGGDVIRLQMVLELADNSEILLEKTWKKGNRQGSSSIRLPDGNEITNEDQVQNQIEEILPVSSATMKTVLLSSQTGLQETLKHIADQENVRNELGMALRKTVMETGGVSVERFRKLLDDRYDSYFKRWDRSQDYPENNRGINNPYKTGTGKVLDAFYRKEESAIKYKEALEYEKELDQLNSEIAKLSEKLVEKKQEQEKFKPLRKGIQERQIKESEIKDIDYELRNIYEINKTWPVYEERLKTIDKEIQQYDNQIKQYNQEMKHVLEQQKLKSLKDRVQKLETLKKEFELAKSEAEKATKVTDEQVKELRNLKSFIDKLETQVNAARLSVSVKAKSDTKLDLKEAGNNTTDKIELIADDERQLNIRGGFILETDNFILNVFSGEGDIENTVDQLEKQKENLGKLLKEIPAESLDQAESLAKNYNQKQAEMNQAERRYREELGDDQHEELIKQIEKASSQKEVREYSEISDDLEKVQKEKAKVENEKDNKSKKISEWKEIYGEHDKVVGKLGQLMHRQTTIKGEIENLPDLPDEFDSAKSFLDYVENLNEEINSLNNELYEIKEEKARIEGREPDSSSEELRLQMEEAEAEFGRIKKEAETLARVRDKTINLLDSMDGNTYKGLTDSFLAWLSKITDERFSEIRMDQDMPEAFVTNEQRVLTYRMLSHGTKGAVALAWRFALCEHMLGNSSAVVALDDPLVDMDPVRRNRAVEAIHEFAQKHQVLIMTCHPDHAEEFGNKSKAKLIDV